MSDEAAFVDTNILVYAFDKTPSTKTESARRLLSSLTDSDRLRLSTQVFQEFLVVVTRKARRPCSVTEALDRLNDLAAWPYFTVDYPAIREAAELSGSAAISFWDALIVISASRIGAKKLYTEDLNHGQMIAGVEIRNPFHDVG